MSDIRLLFPPLAGGPAQGLNDAGVENFQGAIDTYVSRECGQNTGDAIRKGCPKARLEFDRLDIPVSEIPGFGQLQETIQACLARWGDSRKEREFFGHAQEMASRQSVPVLRISDYGTTGLTGSDTDRKGRWFALVKSVGVSIKDDGAGGAFGIGKSSPFAASRFRTVFYGTRTEQGDVAFQGVSRLATHASDLGKLTQGVGFIGEYDPDSGEGGEPVFRAIREEEKIPARFRRSEPGTDIWVIGYRSGPEWSRDLVQSVLENFWPAIHRGTIEFAVSDQTISRETLPELMRRHSSLPDFRAHHFYAAVTAQPIRKKLPVVGNCELYLTTASQDLPRQICMTRQSGMRIYDYAPRACRVPFSGLFRCDDPQGNALLRQLEPPKHDTWDPKREESPDGRKALDAIRGWIRDEVKRLNPLFSGDSFDESELAKYVPDAVPEGLPNDGKGDSEDEQLAPRPRASQPEQHPVTAAVASKSPAPAGQPGAGGGGSKPGSDSSGQPGGKGSGKGGQGDQPSAPALPRLQVRSMHAGANRYQLVIRCPEDFKGRVAVCAIGEDGEKVLLDLESASLEGPVAKPLEISGDAIRGLEFRAGVACRIAVKVDADRKLSLAAVALP